MSIDAQWYKKTAQQKVRLSAGGVVVRNDAGCVLVALVKGNGPDYILPKGGVEAGESLEQAARREIAEEAGFSELLLLDRLGVRERSSFDRKKWIVSHYYLFATQQIYTSPTDTKVAYLVSWYPLQRLPENFFWTEQRELILSRRGAIEKLVLGK